MNSHAARWMFLAVLLSIVAYSVADADAVMFVVGVPAACIAWLITRGTPPRTLPRHVINLLLFVVVAWGSLTLFSEGLGVSLFSEFVAALMVVKLLDRRASRDAAQVLVLSAFLMVGAILTSNSFWLGLLMVVYVPILVGCVLWYQLARVEEQAAGRLVAADPPAGSVRRRVAAVTGMAMSIAVAVFLLMPREIGSKTLGSWGAASVGQVVGFNDEIRLGMGGLISESPEPVIDLELFDSQGDNIGAVGQRFYLRGAVLDSYDIDAGTWTRADSPRNTYQIGPSPLTRPDSTAVGAAPRLWSIRQDVTIRNIASERGHLFSIWQTKQVRVDPPARLEFCPHDGALRVQEHRGKVTYTVYSDTQSPPPDRWEEPDPQDRLDVLIDLPEVAAVARRVLNDAGIEPDPLRRSAADDLAAVAALRNHFTSGGFVYTLQTVSAPAGRDPVEWFLTDYRQGHCEYFASALAAMCRTVGIDARVITGYVATDFNQATDSYIVRASNAHAWVEAEVLPGHWRPFDPTPPADLTRIHEPPRGLLADARRLLDTLEFAWIRAVVGYDADARADLLGPTGSSVSLFPLLDRLGNLANGTRHAPPHALLLAGRNALIAFCVAVLGAALFLRERHRIGQWIATVFRRLLARFVGRAPGTVPPEHVLHRDVLHAYHLAGVPKPEWMPLRSHTDALVRRGTIDAERAPAAARLADRLYAALFAGKTLERNDADEARHDLDNLLAWARDRRRDARRTRKSRRAKAEEPSGAAPTPNARPERQPDG